VPVIGLGHHRVGSVARVRGLVGVVVGLALLLGTAACGGSAPHTTGASAGSDAPGSTPTAGMPIRGATTRDNAAQVTGPGATEWWFVGAIDPASGQAFAASLGTQSAHGTAATAILSIPVGAGAQTIGLFRRGSSAARHTVDVRLGPDALRQLAPGVWHLHIDGKSGLVLYGAPANVHADLIVRATAPGFVTDAMALGGGQSIGWTVGAARATATGDVTIGDRTLHLRGAPAYQDHNWGQFSLSGGSLAGWAWSEAFLPGGRALTLGVITTSSGGSDGGAVLSGSRQLLGLARAPQLHLSYRGWSHLGSFVYPPHMHVITQPGQWSADLSHTARGATPLPLDPGGQDALVDVLARVDGVLRDRHGHVIAVHDAPALYEYESTPASRQRDHAPA
jgi:hypothetical protein